MNLDELIAAADPARGRHVAGGSVDDAKNLIEQLSANHRSVRNGPLPGRPGSGGRSRTKHRADRHAGVAVPVIGVIVAVLIAGVALLGHHGQHARSKPTSQPQTGKRGQVGVRHIVGLGPDDQVDRALINQLSVLREPQTAAARSFNTHAKQGGSGSLAQQLPLVAALTRAVTLAHHESFYLFVTQRSKVMLPGGRVNTRSGGLGTSLRAPFEGFAECCITPQSLRRPVGPQAEPYTMSRRPDWLYVELVPDHVATVQWTFTSPASSAAAGRSARPRTVTVPVHNNIAAIALPNRGSPQRDAWYDANHKLIAQRTPRPSIP